MYSDGGGRGGGRDENVVHVEYASVRAHTYEGKETLPPHYQSTGNRCHPPGDYHHMASQEAPDANYYSIMHAQVVTDAPAVKGDTHAHTHTLHTTHTHTHTHHTHTRTCLLKRGKASSQRDCMTEAASLNSVRADGCSEDL